MSEQHHSGDELDEYKEQVRFLPIANVAKIAKEAKETVQECVSEFISFITSEASDKCMVEKRKTINGEDILWAMRSLGFENYAEALKIYLGGWIIVMKNERQAGTSKDNEDEEEQDTPIHHQQPTNYYQ
ncbi:hypothetical protein BGX34_009600 [Mortierella sp. NVP85]|nr:hypothetical protein BGX34_009600 [Mortierella sp. NVP85]